MNYINIRKTGMDSYQIDIGSVTIALDKQELRELLDEIKEYLE